MEPFGQAARKKELRAQLLAERTVLSDSERSRRAALLADRVLAVPEVAAAPVVAAYVSLRDELPAPLDRLRSAGVTVLLPVLLDDNALAWGTGELVPGRYGLLQPAVADRALDEASVVLVPGLAFDPAGHRLGRGGGSYDRALAGCPALLVGLADDAAVIESVPADAHDVAMHLVVTPTRTLYPSGV